MFRLHCSLHHYHNSSLNLEKKIIFALATTAMLLSAIHKVLQHLAGTVRTRGISVEKPVETQTAYPDS